MEDFSSHTALLPGAIVLAGVCDVSLGTIRTLVVVRGYRLFAGGLGFFEALIWLAVGGRLRGKNGDATRVMERWGSAIRK